MVYLVLGCALAAYGGILGGLFLCQRSLLYHPAGSRPVLADIGLSGVREVELKTSDGLDLRSWYLPPHPKQPVIVYFHGNGGHIGRLGEPLRRFAREAYGVLLAEYRGYGGNPGAPSEQGLYTDGEAALDFLAQEGIAASDIVLWGDSLGSGVAVYLAVRHRVAGLVLEAPFTSVAAAAQRHYPYVPCALMVRDRFDSLSRIGQVTAPLLILHGARDTVVPVSHGRTLLLAANSPKKGWFAPEAGHGNLAKFGAIEVAIDFIERRICRSPDPVAADADFD